MSKDRARITIVFLIMAGGLLLKPSAASAQILPCDTVRLFFIGDVMLHKAQIGKEYTPFLEDLKPLVSRAGLAAANMEFPLGGKPYTGYPSFSAPDSYAEYIASLGFNVFLTANNHILDKGTAGLERTLEKYSAMKGVRFTGTAGKEVPDSTVNPLFVNVNGARIALVNFTYGTNYGEPPASSGVRVRLMKKEDTQELLRRARDGGADFIVALPHWGEEYSLKHSSAQEKYAAWLAEEGADVVIGAHPHVVQDTCSIVTSDGRRVPVVYSLGNAVSNMSAINTRLGLAATITIVRRFLGQVEYKGIRLDFLWCTLPGALQDNYKTVLVQDRIGRRDEWLRGADYDNMTATLERVKNKTGIDKKEIE